MYNVKLKHYKRGETQVSIFNYAVHDGTLSNAEKQRRELIKRLGIGKSRNPFDKEFCTEVSFGFNEIDKWLDMDKEKHERSVKNSCNRAKKEIYDLSRANNWDYFVTLTFNSDKVNRYDYDDCVKKLSQWLKDCRKRSCGADFKYLVVPERHKDGAFHFHGLFANCDGLNFTDSGYKDKKGRIIYNIGKYKLGFTTATKIDSNEAVCKYITKYTTKELAEHAKNKKKYWASRNLDKPIVETFLLDKDIRTVLEEELRNSADFYKNIEFKIKDRECRIEYYECKGLTLSLLD